MSSHHRWLLEQLPKWEGAGLLPPDVSARLREHAEKQIAEEGRGGGESRVAQIVMGALGALFVGAGVLALIAYNWDMVPRHVRMIGSFVLMAVAQALVAWVLRKGEAASQWVREAAGMFAVLSAGGCLALVSQVYNMGGDWPDFLFVWVLLVIPLLWAVRAHSVAVFHLVSISVWAVSLVDHRHSWAAPWVYLPLLAAATPYWPGFAKTRPHLPGPVRWIAALSVTTGLWAIVFYSQRGGVWAGDGWMFMLAAACVTLLPLSRNGIDEKLSRKPQVVIGALCLFTLAFMLSNEWLSKNLGKSLHEVTALPLFWIIAVVFAAFFTLAMLQKRWALAAISTLAVTPLLALVVDPERGGFLLGWSFTSHIFLISLVMIIADFFGAKGAPRLGALLMATLIIVRMADSDLPLMTKAVMFILVGIGFIGFNVFWSRQIAARRKTA